MKIYIISLLSLVLTACHTDSPSHIPPLWQLPGAAAGSVFDNALYTSRRRKVERFTTENFETIMADIQKGGGPVLTKVLGLARVPSEQRQFVIDDVRAHPEIYLKGPRSGDIETLVITLMVHSN